MVWPGRGTGINFVRVSWHPALLGRERREWVEWLFATSWRGCAWKMMVASCVIDGGTMCNGSKWETSAMSSTGEWINSLVFVSSIEHHRTERGKVRHPEDQIQLIPWAKNELRLVFTFLMTKRNWKNIFLWQVKIIWNSNFNVHGSSFIDTQSQSFICVLSLAASTWQRQGWVVLVRSHIAHKPPNLCYLALNGENLLLKSTENEQMIIR